MELTNDTCTHGQQFTGLFKQTHPQLCTMACKYHETNLDGMNTLSQHHGVYLKLSGVIPPESCMFHLLELAVHHADADLPALYEPTWKL